MSRPDTRMRAVLLAAIAAGLCACATAPISPADRQAAIDSEVDLAVCVTEGEKPNFFFNPLPKMLADQVEQRFRPPRKPSFNRLTRLPYGGDAGACQVVISMRADGQAIWNLRHAIATIASTKEEILHTSSQQACGPCFAGMMDGLIIPIIKALDKKGPLSARITGPRETSPTAVAASEAPAPPPPAPTGIPEIDADRAPEPPSDKVAAVKPRTLSELSEKELTEIDMQIMP
ncbi:MAG: hypothetical protein PHS14_06585 [Elusimicrobia bacterium]|nr:hypothetical protein [Elusimicrobiota bacterium]